MGNEPGRNANVTDTKTQEMSGVREYCEQYPVALVLVSPDSKMPEYGPSPTEGPRWCVRALNASGEDSTSVDLLDLIRWLRAHRPDLLTT